MLQLEQRYIYINYNANYKTLCVVFSRQEQEQQLLNTLVKLTFIFRSAESMTAMAAAKTEGEAQSKW